MVSLSLLFKLLLCLLLELFKLDWIIVVINSGRCPSFRLRGRLLLIVLLAILNLGLLLLLLGSHLQLFDLQLPIFSLQVLVHEEALQQVKCIQAHLLHVINKGQSLHGHQVNGLRVFTQLFEILRIDEEAHEIFGLSVKRVDVFGQLNTFTLVD